MLEFIIQPLHIFLNGVIGKDRKAKKTLAKRLSEERAAYNRLHRENKLLNRQYKEAVVERDRSTVECDRLIHQQNRLSAQCSQLQASFNQSKQACVQLEQTLRRQQQASKAQLAIISQEKKDLISEKEQLYSALNALEHEVKNLERNNADYVGIASDDAKKYAAELKRERDTVSRLLRERGSLKAKLETCLYQQPSEGCANDVAVNDDETALNDTLPEALSSLDLSDVSVAIVGGHDNLHSYVTTKFQKDNGIRKNKIRTLSDDHSSSDLGHVKEKIQGCDFIFVITEYISHKLSRSVMELKKKGSLSGEVVRLDKTGTTAVIKSILSHIASQIT